MAPHVRNGKIERRVPVRRVRSVGQGVIGGLDNGRLEPSVLIHPGPDAERGQSLGIVLQPFVRGAEHGDVAATQRPVITPASCIYLLLPVVQEVPDPEGRVLGGDDGAAAIGRLGKIDHFERVHGALDPALWRQ